MKKPKYKSEKSRKRACRKGGRKCMGMAGFTRSDLEKIRNSSRWK